MRKHAIINNNIVTSVVTINDSEYAQLAMHNDLIVDIQDYIIEPQVGWILVGNALAPANLNVPIEDLIKARIRQYQDLAPELLRQLYTQNTLMGVTDQQSDQMFDDYADVLMRIREGTWPTALYRLNLKQPIGFVTQQMIDSWKQLIISKMS